MKYSTLIAQLLGFFLYYFFVCKCNAQVVIDTVPAFQYYQKADSLLTGKKYDESIAMFKKAVPIYEKVKAWDRAAHCHNKLAKCFFKKSEFDKVATHLDRVLRLVPDKLPINNLEVAESYFLLGKKALYRDLNYEKSLEFYSKSLRIKESILKSDDIRFVNLYEMMADVLNKQGKFDQALIMFDRSTAIKEKRYGQGDYRTVSNLSLLVHVYLSKGELQRALKIAESGIETLKREFGNAPNIDIANLYTCLGSIYGDLKNTKKSLFYNEKALKMKEYLKVGNSRQVANDYNDLGVSYLDSGRYEAALKNFHKALSVDTQSPLFKFIIYHNLAAVHGARGELKKSQEYLNRFVPQAQKMLGEDYFELTRAYQVMGINYRKLKQYDKSYELHHKSLVICQNTLGENHIRVVEAYNNLGTLFSAQGDYDTAQQYFEKSLSICLKIFDHKSQKVAYAYFLKGKNLYLNKKYGQANKSLKKAAMANIFPDFKDVDEQYFDINLQIQILDYSCRSFYYENSIQNKDKEFWEYDLVDMYQNIDNKIATNRDKLDNYKDKIEFSKVTNEVYAQAIKCMTSLKINNNAELSERIFLLAEKSRSNALKDLLEESNAYTFSGVDEELLDLKDELQSQQAYYISKKIEVSDSSEIINYQNKIFNIAKRQDSLSIAIEKNYPKYHQLKHQNKVISVPEIQNKLSENNTLIEFFTTDSTTYVFTISKEKYGIKELKTKGLAQHIEDCRKATISKNIISYKKTAKSLYDMMIKPIKEEFVGDELIIVPDGPLWHLNFDLLLTEESISNNPAELPYLLKDYATSYANSATLLFSPFQKTELEGKREGCLAFSFSDSTIVVTVENMSLAALRNIDDDLPGTRKEIKAISEIIDGQYFFGNKSNEGEFKKNAGKYSILHLALHGEVDNEHPENSKLYFTKNKDTIEDNILYSHELFALNIPAELTVLSACNTGAGKVNKGEGIMSLGNAFQYAGAKSLLLSSWEVPDETTPKLMQNFYANLKDGVNKSKALQTAKLQYLRQADPYKSSPFYWGGFYLLGDIAPVDLSDVSHLYWIFGIGSFLLILILVLYFKRKFG